MNRTAPIISAIPDIQNSKDTRHIPIDKVGIKDIKHPVLVKDRSGSEQHTVANFNMYVNLPDQYKGTHMSRYAKPSVTILRGWSRFIHTGNKSPGSFEGSHSPR